MNNIGQGTTPYIRFSMESDLSDAAVIYLTIKQGNVILDMTGDRVIATVMDGSTVLTAHLTQEETLQFRRGLAAVQARWKNNDDEAYESDIINVRFVEALKQEVI